MNLRFASPSSKRVALAAAGIACIAAALAAPPAAVRSQLAAPAAPRREPPPATLAPITDVAAARDPFEPRAADSQPESDPGRATPTPLPPAPLLPPLGNVGPLPANAGAAPFPVGARNLRVSAVATGPHPTGLVEVNGRPRLIEPNDILDGARVIAIDDDGVTLDDGRRLTVPGPNLR